MYPKNKFQFCLKLRIFFKEKIKFLCYNNLLQEQNTYVQKTSREEI